MTTITEEARFRAFLAALSYAAIRQLESPQPVTLPNGQRLRGLALGNDVYLARDGKLYAPVTLALVEGATHGGTTQGFVEVSVERALSRVRVDDVLVAFRALVRARIGRAAASMARFSRLLDV